MARKLTAGVVVRHPGSGAVTFLAPDTDLPDWAVGIVGDHVLTGAGSSRQAAPATEAKPAPTPAPAAPAKTLSGKPPPKSGKGATDAAWTEYARKNGVTVTDEMSRSEVIAAVAAAGAPTE